MASHYDDQTGLARTLAYLCDLHLGAQASGQRASALLPLRPGSRIAFVPNMGIHVSGGGSRRPHDSPHLRFLPTPPAALFSYSELVGSNSPVGLHHALRQKSTRPSRPHADIMGLFSSAAALPTPTANLEPLRFSVPREAISHGPTGFARDVMSRVRAFEDDLCLAELGRLPAYDTELEHDPSSLNVGLLLGFISQINEKRPDESRLDTVFLSPLAFASLARNGGGSDTRLPHPNVLQAGGCTIVAHDLVADGIAYVISSRQGPVFVHGPTVILCGDAEVTIEHYCGTEDVAVPPVPGVPAGHAVRLVSVAAPRHADGRSMDKTGARGRSRGNPASRLADAGRELYNLGQHDKARLALEEAVHDGPEGVATCLCWERALESLGANDDERIASHNDLLVRIDALIVKGFLGSKLLRARERAMQRLGIPHALIDSTLDDLLAQRVSAIASGAAPRS